MLQKLGGKTADLKETYQEGSFFCTQNMNSDRTNPAQQDKSIPITTDDKSNKEAYEIYMKIDQNSADEEDTLVTSPIKEATLTLSKYTNSELNVAQKASTSVVVGRRTRQYTHASQKA